MAQAADFSTPITETPPVGDGAAPAAPEADKAPAEKPAKKAKAAPAGAAVLNVFDGAPKDPEAARRAAPPEDGAPSAAGDKAKGKGRKGKPAAPPELSPEEQEAKRARMEMQARGALKTLINLQKMIVVKQYTGYIAEERLDALLSRLDLTDEELDALAPPLADGMVEEGIEMPWWAQFGLALGGSDVLKRQVEVQGALKAAVAEREEAVGKTKTWNPETAKYE